MEYTTLGRTGLKVSVAGLGCGGFSRLGLATGKSEDEAVRLVREGKAQALMKGSLHTDELMSAVVAESHTPQPFGLGFVAVCAGFIVVAVVLTAAGVVPPP